MLSLLNKGNYCSREKKSILCFAHHQARQLFRRMELMARMIRAVCFDNLAKQTKTLTDYHALSFYGSQIVAKFNNRNSYQNQQLDT